MKTEHHTLPHTTVDPMLADLAAWFARFPQIRTFSLIRVDPRVDRDEVVGQIVADLGTRDMIAADPVNAQVRQVIQCGSLSGEAEFNAIPGRLAHCAIYSRNDDLITYSYRAAVRRGVAFAFVPHPSTLGGIEGGLRAWRRRLYALAVTASNPTITSPTPGAPRGVVVLSPAPWGWTSAEARVWHDSTEARRTTGRTPAQITLNAVTIVTIGGAQ